MALLDRKDLLDALTRLGQLAQAEGQNIELLLVGGSVMAIAFMARESTRDLDVVILTPDSSQVRAMAEVVAQERSWPPDWFNDAAKGFIVGAVRAAVVFSAPGIVVYRPAIEQLLAMKLSAWRDDLDIADARRLLQELCGSYDEVWRSVQPHLQQGRELKAKYAFDDLWEEIHGSH
jgi:hypothetical protein